LALDNKKRKYEHKINNNVSVGNLKNNVVKIFIYQDPKVILEQLVTLFLKSTEAFRPNRKYERTKPKMYRGKYRTFTNYRRAV
ncbi:MAG: hypothetical protein KTR26_20830, partial [Flammeovirgaceae bacterium]|nr:hypothetical protein [Flammeovirgaceae bacterium]